MNHISRTFGLLISSSIFSACGPASLELGNDEVDASAEAVSVFCTRHPKSPKCKPQACVPDNAAACLDLECGSATNNCGQAVDCGACASGESCEANLCIAPTDTEAPTVVQEDVVDDKGIAFFLQNPSKIIGTATDNVGVTELSVRLQSPLNGGSLDQVIADLKLSSAQASYDYSIPFDPKSVPAGVYCLLTTATDAAGLSGFPTPPNPEWDSICPNGIAAQVFGTLTADNHPGSRLIIENKSYDAANRKLTFSVHSEGDGNGGGIAMLWAEVVPPTGESFYVLSQNYGPALQTIDAPVSIDTTGLPSGSYDVILGAACANGNGLGNWIGHAFSI